MGKHHPKVLVVEEKALLGREAENRAKILSEESVRSESGCKYGDKCHFRHLEADGQPSNKSKKGGAKGPVALLKESIQLGCVSQDSYPRKSIST